MLWNHWAEEWALEEPVSFDGRTSSIVVKEGVTSLAISTVYSAWKRWVQREQNAMYSPAIRASGGDAIPGGVTGVTYLLMNGWKLLYDPTKVAVEGVLYSEDFDTAYYTYAGTHVYPATVSALVNQVVTVQKENVVTGDLSSVPTTSEIVSAVLAQLNPDVIAEAILMLATQYPIHADTKRMNGAVIQGNGSENNQWRGLGVQ